MSTISVSYPESIQVRRPSAIGRILILGSLALIAITILVMVVSASVTDLAHHATVSQNSIVSIPVPIPSLADIQPVPSETPAPYPGETSGSGVVAVPVPAPPSQ